MMALNPETNPANLCRVCVRDIADAPSENIFECSDPDQTSIYAKLSAICTQIFTDDKPLADGGVLSLPLNVCLDCKGKIDEAYELHKMCLESHRLLREWLAPTTLEEVTIKEEPLDDVEIEPGMFTALSGIAQAKVFAECLDVPNVAVKAEEPEIIQCEKCGLRVRHMFRLYQHMKIKHSSETFGCDKCRKAFFDEAKLEEHRRIHDHAKPYQCPHCLRRFKGNRHAITHWNHCKKKVLPKDKVEVEEPGEFQCEKCDFTTRQQWLLYKHMKFKHRDEAFGCDKCYEAFFDKDKLEEHRKIHDHAKPYKCPNCPKRFKVRRDVTVHGNQCKGNNPFLCTICGKAYAYSSSLMNHVLCHKEKTVACELCPSKFYTKGALKTHLMSLHSTEKPLSCETCGARFSTASGLRTHLLCHSDVRPFPCGICNMSFKKSHTLNRHMLTHTGEKPHKCSHCDRAFAQCNDLVKHIKSHVGNNPYKCDQCEAAFRLKAELRTHLEVHFQQQQQQQEQGGVRQEPEVTSGLDTLLANDFE